MLLFTIVGHEDMLASAQMSPAAEHPGICAGTRVPLQHVVAGAALCRRHAGDLVCRDCLSPGRLLQGLSIFLLKILRLHESDLVHA